MTKKLKTDVIMNELTGNSGFFKEKAIEKQSQDVFVADEELATPNQQEIKMMVSETTMSTIRKIIKETGKETCTHRFTPTEKKALMAIVFHYKQDGINTNLNEITRIAVNFLIADFQQHGKQSLLAEMINTIYA